MRIQVSGHLGGDPEQFCEQLVITAESWRDAERLAAIYRTYFADLEDVEITEPCGVLT